MPDINDGYPEGDVATRQAIVQQHLSHNIGLLYFLQNDPEVPAAIRADARSWGWCKDEFTETAGVPPQLYIREARRMVGQHVFSGNDTEQAVGDARSVLHSDSIAMGDYVHNCHGTGRTGTRFDGQHSGEFYKPVPPYQIAYGVILPQKTENLLVPVACSASHFGFGALRLEPIWTSLGQAAGWAAVQSIHNSVPVQRIDLRRLQARLHSDRSATIYVSDVSPSSPDFAAVQWFGTLGGLHGLSSDGQPKPKPIMGQFCEAHPGHAAVLDQPLTEALRVSWQKLAPLPDPTKPATRREWIVEAFAKHGL
jgi:FAD dependent oxidoreductase